MSAPELETASSEDIVAVSQFKQTLDLAKEALGDTADSERYQRARDLRIMAEAVSANEAEEARVKARIMQLHQVMTPLNAEAKRLFDEMESEARVKRKEIRDLFLTAMDTGKPPDLSKFLTPNSTASKRLLILGAMEEVGHESLGLLEELREVVKAGHQYKAQYFEALSKFIRAEAVRKAAGAVLFEGELTIDPDKGRSGAAKKQAAYHWQRYREG